MLRASCYTGDTDGAGIFSLDNERFFGAAAFKASTSETYLTFNEQNAYQVVGGSFTFNQGLVWMGVAVDLSFMSGEISINLIFNRVLTFAEAKNLRTLLKSTIARNLGLP